MASGNAWCMASGFDKGISAGRVLDWLEYTRVWRLLRDNSVCFITKTPNNKIAQNPFFVMQISLVVAQGCIFIR